MVRSVTRIYVFLGNYELFQELHVDILEHSDHFLLVHDLLPESLVLVEGRKLADLAPDLLHLHPLHQPVAVLAALLLYLLAPDRLQVVLLDQALGVKGGVLLDDEGFALGVVATGDDILAKAHLGEKVRVTFTEILETTKFNANGQIGKIKEARRYGRLRGPTSSSCGGLWPSAGDFFARAKKGLVILFWQTFGVQ